MVQDSEIFGDDPSEREVSDTIAGTGPGIPDEALAPGKELPLPPTEEEIARAAKKLGANIGERDTLPLEGE